MMFLLPLIVAIFCVMFGSIGMGEGDGVGGLFVVIGFILLSVSFIIFVEDNSPYAGCDVVSREYFDISKEPPHTVEYEILLRCEAEVDG